MMSSAILNSTRAVSRRGFILGNRFISQTAAQNTGYSSRHENDAQKLDQHKQDSLAEQKEGKGQWREELASDAEAFIKAERQEIRATGEEINKLQEETQQLLEKKGLKE